MSNLRPDSLQIAMLLTFGMFGRARKHGKKFLELCQTFFAVWSIALKLLAACASHTAFSRRVAMYVLHKTRVISLVYETMAENERNYEFPTSFKIDWTDFTRMAR